MVGGEERVEGEELGFAFMLDGRWEDRWEEAIPGMVKEEEVHELEEAYAAGVEGGKGVEMEWVLDSAATAHISSDPRPFLHMTPSQGYISTYSGKLEVKGTGVVAIQQQGKKQVLLHNVLYVPSSPHPIGLISIGQEQDKGAIVSGHGSTLTLTLADGSNIVGSKFRKFSQTPSTLFFVQATTNPPEQQIIERVWYAQQQAHEPSSKEQRILELRERYSIDDLGEEEDLKVTLGVFPKKKEVETKLTVGAMSVVDMQWEPVAAAGPEFALTASLQQTIVTPAAILHKRMGHTAYTGLLRMLGRAEGMEGVSVADLKSASTIGGTGGRTCGVCVATKLAARSHPSVQYQITSARPLELVHTDVAGPINTVGWRGERYFCTLLDDFSGYEEVGVLMHKGEAGEWFKGTLNRWEAQTEHRVVRVHSDRGGEYMGRELRRWLEEKGITHMCTTAYSQ